MPGRIDLIVCCCLEDLSRAIWPVVATKRFRIASNDFWFHFMFNGGLSFSFFLENYMEDISLFCGATGAIL